MSFNPVRRYGRSEESLMLPVSLLTTWTRALFRAGRKRQAVGSNPALELDGPWPAASLVPLLLIQAAPPERECARG